MGGVIPGFAGSGNNVYMQIMDANTAQIANGSGFEVYNQSNWANYAIAAPEQAGSGRYIMTVPGYVPAGRYFASVFIQAGVSPAAGDTPTDFVFFDWDGGNVLGLGSALNVGSINGSASAAANLAVSAGAFLRGTAVTGTLTTSQMTTTLTVPVANLLNGRVIYFTSGVNAGLAALITAYVVSGGKLTFIAYGSLAAPSAPANGDSFLVI